MAGRVIDRHHGFDVKAETRRGHVKGIQHGAYLRRHVQEHAIGLAKHLAQNSAKQCRLAGDQGGQNIFVSRRRGAVSPALGLQRQPELRRVLPHDAQEIAFLGPVPARIEHQAADAQHLQPLDGSLQGLTFPQHPAGRVSLQY